MGTLICSVSAHTFYQSVVCQQLLCYARSTRDMGVFQRLLNSRLGGGCLRLIVLREWHTTEQIFLVQLHKIALKWLYSRAPETWHPQFSAAVRNSPISCNLVSLPDFTLLSEAAAVHAICAIAGTSCSRMSGRKALEICHLNRLACETASLNFDLKDLKTAR